MPELASVPSVDGPSADPAGPVERIGRIAELIEKSGDRNEALGRLAPEVVDALHEQRLFRLLLPRVYGGDEVDLGTWFRATEALARLDASTAWCVGQINGCSATASAVAPEVARKIWGEPRAALTWGPPIKSRAEEVDGGHRVSGEWGMSSGSRHATWIGLMAPVFDKTGAKVALPHNAISRTFFVPASAVTWIDNWNTIGLTATNSGGFKVDGVVVPHGYSVLLPQPVAVDFPGALYRFPLNNLYATGFSGVALGIARSMLDAAVALASEKKPYLARLALNENHVVQLQIGEAEARLRSARTFVETTVQRVWQEVVASGKLTIPQRIEIRMATTFAIHEAKAVADVAWDVAGANAIFETGPFERRYRDIRTLTQQLQGRKSHLQEVGAYILGLEPNLRHA
jgi:alkylation response protein AidB-like acyl-CoA dehydrogenase